MAVVVEKSIFVLLLVLCLALTSQAFIQTMRLEVSSGETDDGDSFECTSVLRSKVADATPLNIGNITRICFQGFWTLFSEPNFATKPSYNFYMNESCWPRTTFPYLSFRYNGPKNTSQDSISFYTDKFWQGEETTVTGPAHAGIPSGLSVVTTGKTKWTLFTGQDFEGQSKCAGVYTSPDWEMDYWSDVTINFSLSNVGSVIRGCDPDVIAEIQRQARSGVKFN